MASELTETMKLLQMLQLMGEDSSSSRRGAASASKADNSMRQTSMCALSGDYIMVVAIDFGTTFSGYSFSFKNDMDNVIMNKSWGTGFVSYKTPTCVLVDENQRFVDFGFDAQKKYASMVEKHEEGHMYFDRFKMKLHNNKELNRHTMIKASDGRREMPALDIFAMTLAYLRKHILQAISSSPESGGSANESLIRWVLTVPAIWSDSSKQFMREAAFKAGMIPENNSNRLLIALEPEAASLYCRSIEINQFVERTRQTSIDCSAGTKYLVVDAGGGTLDVTAHEILPNKTVKELFYATGGALGGTKVDEKYIELLERIFGKAFIDGFKGRKPSIWLQMINDFESRKRAILPEKKSSMNLQILWDFAEEFKGSTGKDISAAITNCGVAGVKFGNGQLQISADLARSLFVDVTNGIVQHLKGLMRKPELRGVKYFFLVGGLSESEMVQAAIVEAFKAESVVILIPDEASLAVMKGAVAFGHEPDVISSRRSKLTYGVDSCIQFDPSKHPASKKLEVSGRVYCKDIFEVYITKEEEVDQNYSKKVVFRPVRESQRAASIEIYCSDDKEVRFITDRNAQKLGEISVDWAGSGLDRKLEVTMTFGGTEIHVFAKTFPGGNTAETKIDFLT